jgi:hypothetical protein
MGAINVKSLQAGVKMLSLEIESSKKKELEAAIDEYLSEQELGYECPSCKKDIPDLKACPYCGESFEEEDADTEEVEEDAEDTDTEDAEPISDEDAEEVAKAVVSKEKGKGKDKGKDKNKNKDKESEKTDSEDAKPEKEGRGRPQGKSKSTEEKEKMFDELVAGIDEIVGEDFEKRDRKTGVTYVKEGKRLLKAVSTGKSLSVEFNVEVESKDENLTAYTEEEAKAKHLGSTRAIYTLGETDVALKLVKKAFKTFNA